MAVRIPKYIDDLPQILWWELDEVCVFSGLFGLGIIMGATFLGFIMGLIASFLLSKLKAGRGAEFIMHWGYWNGIIPIKPESWRERFRE